jgi:peptidoglycan/LPS O-acetylase OafA/YrhL
MFGTLRLLLAFFVAIGHTGTVIFGINFGICAVTIFFMLSGFVMTGLLRTKFTSFATIPKFYADRLLRIYPQFIFFYLLYVLFFEYSGFQGAGYPIDPFSIKNFLLSLAIVPLNWAVLSGSVFHIFSEFGGLTRYILIHPAWSLGLEMQFYIIFPFILFLRSRLVAVIASAVLFALAALDVVNQPVYGYFFLPGVLFVFLSGSLMYDYNNGKKQAGVLLLLIYAFTLALYVACSMMDKLATYNKAVLLGLIVGIPLVFILSNLKRRGFDEWLGNVSYGAFLCHVLVIDAAANYGVFTAVDSLGIYLSCVFILGAIGHYLVERPVHAMRKRLQSRVRKQNTETDVVAKQELQSS